MKRLKKILSLLTISALVFSLCACSKSSEWVYKTDDYTMYSGQYLAYLYNAVNTAMSQSGNSEINMLINSDVEGKTGTEYADDQASEAAKKEMGARIDFAQQGLSLSEEDNNNINSSLSSQYDQYSDSMKALGISKESFRAYLEGSKITELLKNHYYGENGTQKSTDDQIKQYITEHGASYKYISITKDDDEDTEEEYDEGEDTEAQSSEESSQSSTENQAQSSAENQAQSSASGESQSSESSAQSSEEAQKKDQSSVVDDYVNQINQCGKSIDDINKEYQMSDGTAEADVTALELSFALDSETSLSSELHQAIFSAQAGGPAVKGENEDEFFIVQRYDVNTQEVFDKNKDAAKTQMEDDSYKQKLQEAADQKNYKENGMKIFKYSASHLVRRIEDLQAQ